MSIEDASPDEAEIVGDSDSRRIRKSTLATETVIGSRDPYSDIRGANLIVGPPALDDLLHALTHCDEAGFEFGRRMVEHGKEKVAKRFGATAHPSIRAARETSIRESANVVAILQVLLTRTVNRCELPDCGCQVLHFCPVCLQWHCDTVWGEKAARSELTSCAMCTMTHPREVRS